MRLELGMRAQSMSEGHRKKIIAILRLRISPAKHSIPVSNKTLIGLPYRHVRLLPLTPIPQIKAPGSILAGSNEPFHPNTTLRCKSIVGVGFYRGLPDLGGLI